MYVPNKVGLTALQLCLTTGYGVDLYLILPSLHSCMEAIFSNVYQENKEELSQWSFSTLDQQRVSCGVDNVETQHKYEELGAMGLLSDTPLHFDDIFLAGLEMMIGSVTNTLP